MTSDERKTLVAIATEYDEAARVYAGQRQRAEDCRRSAAAIRTALAEIDALNRLHLSMEATAPYGTPRKGITHPDSIALLTSLEKALRDWSGDLRDSGRQYVHAKNAAYAIGCALAEIDAHNAPCAMPDCPHDGTGCNRCLAVENAALLSALREARAQANEAHRLAIESKRKMDAAYDHADLIQHEMTTATDDCPHPSDAWTCCSACHLKVMRERDEARARGDTLVESLTEIERRLREDAAPLVELANADGTPRMRHAWKAVYSSAVHAQGSVARTQPDGLTMDDVTHAYEASLNERDRELATLREQVADLTHADKCHAEFYARLCDALHIPEPHAVDGDVFDAIADLEARAIPQWWIHRAHPLEIRVTFRDGTGHSIALNGDGSVDRYDVTECGDHHGDYVHATLASALAAAAKERP